MAYGLWNKDASPRQKAVNIAVLSLSCLTIYGASASILVFNDVAARLILTRFSGHIAVIHLSPRTLTDSCIPSQSAGEFCCRSDQYTV